MHLQRRILLLLAVPDFSGRTWCKSLLAEDANVICLDNFFTGTQRNVEHLLDTKHFELIRSFSAV
jgi:UDP-glucuronate decarboxylase